MSNSAQPHRRKPTRLPSPWDSLGKNTGVGCHFLLQCMKVKSDSEVAQSCLILRDPMDCSLPGASAHGIFQARVLGWVAIAYSYIFPNHFGIFNFTTFYLCLSASDILFLFPIFVFKKLYSPWWRLWQLFPQYHQVGVNHIYNFSTILAF